MVLAHDAFPSSPLEVDGAEVIATGYRTVWFLFQGKPYDIGRFYRPDGTWTGYYVDILEPVQWTNADPRTLHPLVDLFLDIWITPDRRYLVLDEDEFDQAVATGHLSPSQAHHARRTLAELVEQVERGAFPPAIVTGFVGENDP